MASKTFILDSNVLIDNENAIEKIINGKDNKDINKVCLPWTVIQELDGLKKDIKIGHRAFRAIKKLEEFADQINLFTIPAPSHLKNDDAILWEIQQCKIFGAILVTNDILLRFKAKKLGIPAEGFRESNPFLSESQKYTGFIADGEDFVTNCFYWKDGKLFYNKQNEEKSLDYDNELWTLKPKTPYQNALMELILDEDIDVVSVQSEAGYGKTQLALAGAIQLLVGKKERKFKKIYIFKPNWEIGNELGFLPGSADEKMAPYFRPIIDLIEKLNERKAIPKIWKDQPKVAEGLNGELNKKKLELLPINFIRGMNIDNAIVIVDEAQCLSRAEARSVLSRMGENVKVILTGDVNQIDNPHLNSDNNGLSWSTAKFKGAKNYGHVVLSGRSSRGPIADLVRNTGL